jgi:hypothetical protein
VPGLGPVPKYTKGEIERYVAALPKYLSDAAERMKGPKGVWLERSKVRAAGGDPTAIPINRTGKRKYTKRDVLCSSRNVQSKVTPPADRTLAPVPPAANPPGTGSDLILLEIPSDGPCAVPTAENPSGTGSARPLIVPAVQPSPGPRQSRLEHIAGSSKDDPM